MAPPGVETVTIVVDYASATSQSNPSIGTARQALNILQNHYVSLVPTIRLILRMLIRLIAVEGGTNGESHRGQYAVSRLYLVASMRTQYSFRSPIAW